MITIFSKLINSLVKMAPTIYNINDAQMKSKIAAFDYDHTLVCPKDGATFAKDVDDWQWLYPNIPEQLKRYNDEGFSVVIFTNQSKPWKVVQIQSVAKSLEIPVFVVVAQEKCDYKPNPVLYEVLVGSANVDKDESFFVGDALGRKGDWADSDKVFAENIGLRCYSPEKMFASEEEPLLFQPLNLSEAKQIIIMVGYPGSGKSSVAKNICANTNFVLIQGDVHKTSAKMIKAALPSVQEGKSIIFDATNSSCKKRAEYMVFAKKHNYEALCIHVATPLDVAYKRNKLRDDDKQVPKIAYSVYTKHYEAPSTDEGFGLIVLEK